MSQFAQIPPRRAWALLAVLWAVFASLVLAPGDLLITSHWGDGLHLIDILERMNQAQRPHLDFVTPIGTWAFTPITALMAAGLPPGQAYLMAQVILAGVFAACALGLLTGRMPIALALGLGILVLITTIALTHGRPATSLSINVHYNRWAWALSFIALPLALLPPRSTSLWTGLSLGACLTALVLIKPTYFAALLPVVVLGLILTRQYRALTIGLCTGLGLAAVVTLVWGTGFWLAYLGDLLYVARSPLRSPPGGSLAQMLIGPAMLAPTALTLLAAIWLIRSQLPRQAILLIATYLAGAFISTQNAGHDPFFLGPVAVLLLAWSGPLPAPWRSRFAWLSLGIFVALAPNLINMASSPVRAALADRADFAPLVPGNDRLANILVSRSVAHTLGQRHLETVPPSEPPRFRGAPLPPCQSDLTPAYFAAIADDLASQNLAQGRTLFVADFLSPLWLFGDHPPLLGAAPWSYGALPGLENADYLIFPTCPNRASVHRSMLQALEDLPMTERHRHPLYRLYEL